MIGFGSSARSDEHGVAQQALDRLALLEAESLLPDVVLMDLLMPRMDGIQATAAIKARYPAIEVVALTSFIEEEKVHAALQAGAAGYLLVVDGTRPKTLEGGLEIVEQVNGNIGTLPFVLVLNKVDLTDQWKVEDAHLMAIQERAHATIRTSAKTGAGVEDAFLRLAEAAIRS